MYEYSTVLYSIFACYASQKQTHDILLDSKSCGKTPNSFKHETELMLM